MRVVNINRTPRCDVYGGRGSVWGNKKFIIGRDGTREEVVAKHKAWWATQTELQAKAKRELKGKTVGCHCAPLPCHLDNIAETVNRDD